MKVDPAQVDARRGVGRRRAVGWTRTGARVVEERDAPDDPFFEEAQARDTPPDLTTHQADAVRAIEDALASGAPKTLLLHGVTGSGKTEVYLRAIAAARAKKVGAIVLVPEIALTPQLVARFRQRFETPIAVMHSGLTDTERLAAWRDNRSAYAAIHGDGAWAAQDLFYATIARLYEGGGLGGARVVATVP